MKNHGSGLTSVLFIVTALVILSSTVVTRMTTSHVPRPEASSDSKLLAKSHRLVKRFAPALFIAPSMFTVNFGVVWYYFSNPASTPITSLGVSQQAADILHDKALLAMSQTMEQYADSHPAIAAKILADIREIAIMESGGSLRTDDAKEGDQVETQLYTFFQQHPDLQDDVVEKFTQDTASLNLSPARPKAANSDGVDTNDDVPTDWAHAFSPPTPDANGLFT